MNSGFRAATILCSAAVLTVACSQSQPQPQPQPNNGPEIERTEPTASCVVERGNEGITGSWGRAATRTDSRDGFGRILHGDCGIENSEPSAFSSYDQLDGSRTIGLHLQTLCAPFEVAIDDADDYVSVRVRTTIVSDIAATCGGDIEARLGTYVITLAADLGDRRVLPV